MIKLLTILLTFIGFEAFGQSVRIDTFNLKKSEQFQDLQADKMNFPVIRTGRGKIDSLINFDLKNRFRSNEFPIEPLDSTLIKWARGQIIYLDFKITYNSNGILSLNISAEGCGAYCTGWTDYFNYSTVSGKRLYISEIVDTTGEFRTLVYKDKESQFELRKRELREILDNADIDQPTYDWVLEYYEDCGNSFDLSIFVIYPDRLEIINECNLPNAIKSLTPIITLKYKKAEIEAYLKIKR